METIVELNNKYCKEIQELKQKNEKLKNSLEREVKVDEGRMKNEVKNLVSKEVKMLEEEKEQQEIDMRLIIREQGEEQEKNKWREK